MDKSFDYLFEKDMMLTRVHFFKYDVLWDQSCRFRDVTILKKKCRMELAQNIFCFF